LTVLGSLALGVVLAVRAGRVLFAGRAGVGAGQSAGAGGDVAQYRAVSGPRVGAPGRHWQERGDDQPGGGGVAQGVGPGTGNAHRSATDLQSVWAKRGYDVLDLDAGGGPAGGCAADRTTVARHAGLSAGSTGATGGTGAGGRSVSGR